MSLQENIIQIWKDYGIDPTSNPIIRPADIQKASIKANGTPILLWYGQYCGPGTNHGQQNPEPVDSLDLLCKFHDTYYGDDNADDALMSSVQYLLENSMLENTKVNGYGHAIDSQAFYAASAMWKNRNTLIFIWLALFVAIYGSFLTYSIVKSRKSTK